MVESRCGSNKAGGLSAAEVYENLDRRDERVDLIPDNGRYLLFAHFASIARFVRTDETRTMRAWEMR